jgi:hypothetical protein
MTSDVSREKRSLSAFARQTWVALLAPILTGVAVIYVTAVWHPWEPAPTLRHTAVNLLVANEPASGLREPVVIVSNSTGICQVPSQADPSPNAFRCLGGNYIYDPCFGGYLSPLVCISSPWSKTGIRFHPSAFEFFLANGASARWNPNSSQAMPTGHIAYGTPGGLSKKPPWALELANGLRCLDAEGATFEIAGERANYGCETPGSHRHQQEWVIGQPNRGIEPWIVSVLPTVGQPQTSEVAVKAVWY